jgi:large subunit ribosomal protein L17
MRHRTHKHVLGVKTAHRRSLVANLAAALFTNARITTTLSRARALRPFSERLITYAKKAAESSDKAVKLHYYRLALAKLRDEAACALLFKERAAQFLGRNGGYTRIYKLDARKGDASEQALIELVAKDDKAPAMTPKAKAAKKPKQKKEAAAAPAQA